MEIRKISVFALPLVVLFSLFSSLMVGQDATGKITGVVTDPGGAVVPGAKVVVTNTATNISHETTTDASGSYQVLQLPIGSYTAAAQAPGFEQVTVQSKNSLEINQTLRMDVHLEIGKVSNTVTVESGASLVETENQTVGATVTGQAIFELPLNGRDTLDLLRTQPGVTPTNPTSGAAGNYSIGGGRTDSVTYLLDGGLNNNLLTNGVVADPNPDSIAEFRVLESDYSAEYGRNSGGIVSVVTKSGTNTFHGTAFDYLRNNFFDANRFFNNEQGISVPILKRNQFGGTVGGPIVKNKLFFFFSYEGQRQSSVDTNPGKVTTFTPAEANGDFSGSAQQALVATYLLANPQYQANPALASQGIIDPNAINPVAKAYFAHGLIPTSSTGYLFPQGVSSDNFNEYLGKFDYNLTSMDVISGTFTTNDHPVLYPFGFDANGSIPVTSVTGYPVNYSNTDYFGSVTYTHTFTPSLLTELRVTAQRSNHTQAIPASAKPNGLQLGANVPSDDPTGPPLIGLLGSNTTIGFSPQGPTHEIDNTYQFSENLSWTKGAHSLKFGLSFSPYQNNTVYDYFVNGEYFFYGPSTGVGSKVDLADFLMGLPDEFLQFGRAPSNVRSHQYGAFVQDGWKVTRNFTLNLGVRYEYAQPKYDTQGKSFAFIPGLQSQRFVNAPPGLVFPGDPGAPTGANFPVKNNFAPRFGFAWDVFGNAKTSIRGGFGVFYDILKAEDNLQFNGQAPFYGFADVFPAGATPGATGTGLQDPYASSGAVDPFPSKVPTKNIDFNAAGYLPFGGGGVYFVDPHLRTPYTYQYNLSLQQQLPFNTFLELAYIGYDAHKQTGLVDVNPFVPGTNQRLYGSNFSYLEEFQNIGKSNYNGLQVNYRRAVSNMGAWGSSFWTVGYTWSHEIDNSSGFRQNSSTVPYYGHDLFRASGDTDVRQVFTLSGGWDLPFDQLWQHGPKLLTKGWSVYPILTMHTGFPLDILAKLNDSRTNPGPSGAGDPGLVRADLVSTQLTTLNAHNTVTLNNPSAGAAGTGNYYFDPGNFSISRILAANGVGSTPLTAYPYGTFPRNGLRGPGFTNLDFSISKHFIVRENMNVELRGDAFNVFNHANFQSPDLTPTDPNFGQISNTYDPRILQLALHFQF